MIGLKIDGPCAWITLDRPQKANALTSEMLAALSEALDQVREAQCNALILTGTGRVFSAGADMDAARRGLATSPAWEEVSSKIAAFEGLSIAALNGTVAGGAMGMVLACDLRICVASAKFFYPVIKLGFLPQPSDPARLSALIGPARSKAMLLTAQKISAQEAEQWGLVDKICPPELLIQVAREMVVPALGVSAAYLTRLKRVCET